MAYQAIIFKTDKTTVEVIVKNREDLSSLTSNVISKISDRILVSINQSNDLQQNKWFIDQEEPNTIILMRMYPRLHKIKGDVVILLGFDLQDIPMIEKRIYFMDL